MFRFDFRQPDDECHDSSSIINISSVFLTHSTIILNGCHGHARFLSKDSRSLNHRHRNLFLIRNLLSGLSDNPRRPSGHANNNTTTAHSHRGYCLSGLLQLSRRVVVRDIMFCKFTHKLTAGTSTASSEEFRRN